MELVDLGGYPEIYADGIAGVQILGCCARVLYFTFMQSAAGVYRRHAVVSIVRPVSSLGQLSTVSGLKNGIVPQLAVQ